MPILTLSDVKASLASLKINNNQHFTIIPYISRPALSYREEKEEAPTKEEDPPPPLPPIDNESSDDLFVFLLSIFARRNFLRNRWEATR